MTRRKVCVGLAAAGVLFFLGQPALPAWGSTRPPLKSSLPHLRTLFARPVFRKPELSPRAHALAFVVPSRHHRRRIVEVLDLGTLLSHGRMLIKASERFPRGVHVLALRWVSPHLLFVITRSPRPAGRLAFGILDDRLSKHAYRSLHIFAGSGNGPKARVSVAAVRSSGPILLWRSAPSADPVLYRYDLAMERLSPFCRVPLAGAQVLVDTRGWPRVAAVTGLRDPAPAVLVGRGHCASWTAVTGRFRPRDLRRYDHFLAVGPHGRGVYLLAPTPTPARTLGLYRFGLTHFRRTLLVANPAIDVYRPRRKRWPSFIWGRHRRRLIGVNFMRGRPRTYWIHPRDPLVRLLRGLGHELQGEVVRVLGMGPHGRIILLETLGDRNPGRYYLYARRPTPSLTFLMARHPVLHESTMVPLTALRIPEGKTVLYTYLARPVKRVPGALVVLAHKGPFGRRFVWFYDPLVQALARAGYSVLAVNYHGSGGYGAVYEAAGVRGWRTVVPDDLVTAARWAQAHRLARAGRIVALGEGLGADAALMAAARDPALFAGVVIVDPEAARLDLAHPAVSMAAGGNLTASPPRRSAPVLLVRFTKRRRPDASSLNLLRQLHQKVAGKIHYHPVPEDGSRRGDRWAKALHAVLAFLERRLGALPPSSS